MQKRRKFTIFYAIAWTFAATAAQADAVFDGTMGPAGEISGDMVVTEQDGMRAGENLFHSFSTLSVNPGESLLFTSDFAGLTNNVISRVTGNDPSVFNGPIFSDIPGAALWLINPNGLVFGEGSLVDGDRRASGWAA